jgi:citrate lyase beta subunit
LDEEPQDRQRSTGLLVPASQPKQVTGAGRFPADELIFDLAGVARDQKDTARAGVADALQTSDYGERIISVRVNAIDTMWAYRDVVDVVERAGEFVDCIVLPDVMAPGDIEFVDNLLRMIEERLDLAHTIGIVAQIDNAAALTLINEVALVSERLEALIFDSAAMGESLGTTAPGRGAHGDPWRAIRMQVLVAARAAHVQAIEAHTVDVDDDTFSAAVQRSHGLGYDGVTCARPDQIDQANAIFAAS